MGVRADERAILELLLEHGVDYETIGAVLSTGTEGARARTRAALTSIADADAEVDDTLADFLLGRAVASERTRTVQSLAKDPEANALARRIADALRTEFEGIEPPHIPSLHTVPESLASENGDRAVEAEQPVGRRSRRRTFFRIVLVTLVAAAAALAVTLALPVEDTDEQDAASEEQVPVTELRDRITLRAPDGGGARGQAVIGFKSESNAFLALDLEGLEPAPDGQVHLLWIDVASGRGLPMPPPIPIAPDGSYRDRLGLPIELVAALDQGQSLEVVTIPAGELRALRRGFDTSVGTDLAAHIEDLPSHSGVTVLEGEIPSLQAASAIG